MNEYPATPELNKLEKVVDKSQSIGEFVEWLWQAKEIHFAKFHKHTNECFSQETSSAPYCGYYNGQLHVINFNLQDRLAEFFGIDLEKVEEEKRAVLEYARRKAQDRVVRELT